MLWGSAYKTSVAAKKEEGGVIYKDGGVVNLARAVIEGRRSARRKEEEGGRVNLARVAFELFEHLVVGQLHRIVLLETFQAVPASRDYSSY